MAIQDLPFRKKELEVNVHNPSKLPVIDYHNLSILQGDLKTLTEENKTKLCKSILEHGYFIPAFVWRSGEDMFILDATQRYHALEELEKQGYTIPAIPYIEIEAKDKKDAAQKLLQITSRYGEINQETSFFTDFDIELDYINDIEIPELDIKLEELESKDIVEDEIPDVPEDPITQEGDLWLCGSHRVLCGDATKAEDVERLMQGKSIELLFTSPPYTDMRNYSNNSDLETRHLTAFISLFAQKTNYLVINLGIQRKDYEIVEYWQEYISKAKENNYTFLSWNVWNKEEARSLSQHKAFFPLCHEWLFVFGHEINELNKTIECKTGGSKASGKFTPAKVSNLKNIKDKKINREYIVGAYKKLATVITTGVSIDSEHPAAFPLSIPFEYIKAMTQEKDIVADPFLGSGTTLIAADQLNRICYGMEMAPHYVAVILERYYKLTGNDPIREDGKNWSELKSI
jgi:DNA modification methylase